MWAYSFEPAKALVRGLTATPTAAFRVRLGNYQPHRGSGAVLSRIAGKIPLRAGPFEREITSAGSSGGSHDPGWVGVWVGEDGRGVRRFLSRPKSAAQRRSHGPTRHQEPFRAPHCTSPFPCGSLCVPINPHSAGPPPCTRHSMSDTDPNLVHVFRRRFFLLSKDVSISYTNHQLP